MRYGIMKRLSIEPVTLESDKKDAVLIRIIGAQPTLLTEAEAMDFTDAIRAIVFNRRSARR